MSKFVVGDLVQDSLGRKGIVTGYQNKDLVIVQIGHCSVVEPEIEFTELVYYERNIDYKNTMPVWK